MMEVVCLFLLLFYYLSLLQFILIFNINSFMAQQFNKEANYEEKQQQFGGQTQVRFGGSFQNREKLEHPILDYILNRNRQLVDANHVNKNNSIALALSNIFRSISMPNHCIVCDQEGTIDCIAFNSNCDHKNLFCKSCLHLYAIYYVQQLYRVVCPNNVCNNQMEVQGQFFKSLPPIVQNKYIKYNQFYSNLSDKCIKMCPREGCLGSIVLTHNQQVSKCNACSFELCSECFLGNHEGECFQFQNQYFQTFLSYRQCGSCKKIVITLQNNNRLKCICSYQTCYLCREIWNPNHSKYHNEYTLVDKSPNEDFIADFPVVKEKTCGQKCSERICFIMTFLPRIIITLVLFCLLVALFGLVIVAALLGCFCIIHKTKRDRYISSSDRRNNKEISGCISGMCIAYFSLFGKVIDTFLTY